MTDLVRQAVDEVVRTSYGRLLSCLAADHRDLVGAEDALSDAIARALETWPARGVPERPEAWLVTVARRKMIDGHRRSAVAARAEPALQLQVDEHAELAGAPSSPVPDKRLELLFVCAHPAIDGGVRAPLMLQTVLGIDAARIASAFLVSPAAMSQRLVRAKKKILDAGITFRVPEADDLRERIGAVLDAIYAAFGTGWDGDPTGPATGLADEALRLGRVTQELIPDQSAVHGLQALMLYSHSRRGARRTPAGDFVPLAEQDTALWDHDMIAAGDAALAHASRCGPAGPFVIEAMIHGVHAWRARNGSIDWGLIAGFYDALLRVAPSVGASVARAGAILEAEGPEAALAALEAIEHPRIEHYQPWWTVRAHALLRLGSPDAIEAVHTAAGLTDDDAVRRYLLGLLPE